MKILINLLIVINVLLISSCEDIFQNNDGPWSQAPVAFLFRDTTTKWDESYYEINPLRSIPLFFWVINSNGDTVKMFPDYLPAEIIPLENHYYYITYGNTDDFDLVGEDKKAPKTLRWPVIKKDSLNKFFSKYKCKDSLIFAKDVQFNDNQYFTFNISEFRWLNNNILLDVYNTSVLISSSFEEYTKNINKRNATEYLKEHGEGVDTNFLDFPSFVTTISAGIYMFDGDERNYVVPVFMDSLGRIYENEITKDVIKNKLEENGSLNVLSSGCLGWDSVMRQQFKDTLNFHIRNNTLDDITFIKYR